MEISTKSYLTPTSSHYLLYLAEWRPTDHKQSYGDESVANENQEERVTCRQWKPRILFQLNKIKMDRYVHKKSGLIVELLVLVFFIVNKSLAFFYSFGIFITFSFSNEFYCISDDIFRFIFDAMIIYFSFGRFNED